MALDTVPTDVIADDLIRTYHRATLRLAGTVRAGLERGLDPERVGTLGQQRGDATQAYRARQLAAARAIVAELERLGPRAAPIIARRAYESALFAVDRHAYARGAAALESRFGGVHQRAVAALAANMSASLEAAAGRAGANVAAVFARADALESGIPPRGFPFVGRRVDDPWRRVGLDAVGEGLVTLETRREVSAQLVKRLVNEGTADALTGYVDRAGRRWSLDRYAAMVARTTTREATSRATVERLTEHGLDLVTVSSHPHAADECTPYDGETFALDAGDHDYDVLDELPPFHPNCRHVLTPAGASLERFERDLGLAAENGLGPDDVAPPPAPPALGSTIAPPAPLPPDVPGEAPPFGLSAPSRDRGTLEREEAERVAYAIGNDPGPDLEADAARDIDHDAEAERELDAIKAALGPDTMALLGEMAHGRHGLKWATEPELLRDLRDGRTSIEAIEARAYDEYMEREDRRIGRERGAAERGLERGQIPCFVCGRFKRRPADVCDYCGDDPVTYNSTAREVAEFNRAYGYAS